MNRVDRPCMAGRWKYVERSIYMYGEGKRTERKTAGKMEEQRQGITRKIWCGLGAGI